MVKRIILMSSCPVYIFIVFLALALVGTGQGKLALGAPGSAGIDQTKAQIVSLIEAGKSAQADAAVAGIIALPASMEKGQALQIIASAYQNAGQADRAIKLCDYVLQNWPKENFAVWAGMSMVISQIDKGDMAAADGTTERIIANYADNTGLPAVISVIADIYSWRKMYGRAERLYGIVADRSPNSSFAAKARLSTATVKILTLLKDERYLDAKKQVDVMVADFKDYQDLPQMLFRIGQDFGWHAKYGEAKDVFGRLIENYPSGSLAQQARLWSAKAGVCALIRQQATDEDVVAATDKLIGDLKGDGGLPEALYWISGEYEWTRAYPNKCQMAKQMYERVIREYPTSAEAGKARLDIRRVDIHAMIIADDLSKAEVMTSTLIADFKDNSYISSTLGQIATLYYTTAMAIKEQDNQEQAKSYFTKAENAWQQVIDKMPAKAGDTDNAYYLAGCCRRGQERWEDAIAYFQIVLDNWPNCEYASAAQIGIAWCYQALSDSGKISKEQAKPLIEQAYVSLLQKYPGGYGTDHAAFALAEISAQKGDKAVAAEYYRIFLDSSKPGDSRITRAKSKLVRLTGVVETTKLEGNNK
jgi:TolA-binding protein